MAPTFSTRTVDRLIRHASRVKLTFTNGEQGVFTITYRDRRCFETLCGAKFDRSDIRDWAVQYPNGLEPVKHRQLSEHETSALFQALAYYIDKHAGSDLAARTMLHTRNALNALSEADTFTLTRPDIKV